jgi:hypothetical protein
VIQIDKNVPLPAPKRGVGSAKYPWRLLEVGDSFLFSGANKHGKSASAQAIRAGRVLGRKFTVRKMDDGSYRCWRVA